ncbi:MAG TPA: hypothetical protein VMV45_02620 [Casimicrobiaceae bacterium]|nr:hypothetical protein [Casimicrobiaceae bacterium]
MPQEPDDLLALQGLLMLWPNSGARCWALRRSPKDQAEEWRWTLAQYSTSNSPGVLVPMAEAGFGAVSLAELYARDAAQRDISQRVFAEWSLPLSL